MASNSFGVQPPSPAPYAPGSESYSAAQTKARQKAAADAAAAAAKKKASDAAAAKKKAADKTAADQKAAADAKAKAAQPKPGTQSVDPSAAGFQAAPGTDYNQNPGLYGLTAAQAASQITINASGLSPSAATPSFLTPGGTGGAEGQTVTMSVLELEQEFWSLPAYQQQQIEQQLWDAGFFSDSQKAKGKPNFSSAAIAPEVSSALAAAANQAIVSGKEFTSMLTSAAADPANAPTAPVKPAVFGHGTNAVIDLRNPSDIAYAAQSIFQNALGRAPTPEEVAAATTALQSADYQTQYAKWQASEADAANAFADQQSARDASFAAQHPDAIGGTPVAGTTGTTANGTPVGTTASTTAPATVGGVTLASSPKGAPGVLGFLAATIAHESQGSGQYTALNPSSKAGGAYQFLPSTWKSEAAAAGYGQYANTPPQQVPPAVQDAVAAYMATNLYSAAGGDWGKVAKAWYAGPGNMNKPDNFYPGGANNGLTIGAYASFVTNYMAAHGSPASPQNAGLAGLGTGAGTVAGSQPTGAGGGGYVNPLSQGSWGLARTDQGVDYIPKTPSPILALGNGVVIRSTMASGWPGGAFIAYRLTDGPASGQVVFVAEHLSGLVPLGTQVKAGQQIAVGMPGYPWIETGWANSTGTAPIVTYGKNPDGTPMEGGQDFARLMIKLGAGAMQNPGGGPLYPGGPDISTVDFGTGTGTGGSTTTNTAGGADMFTPGTTTTETAAPTSDAFLFNQASTGPNLVPYGAHNILNAVGTINGMIRQQR